VNRRPLILTLFCWIGITIGFGGTILSFFSSLPLLESRDRYVSAFSEDAARIFHPAASLATSNELRALAEKEADAIYGRRGVALPLNAANFVLSLLLLSGCARTLRGLSSGPEAIRFAAAVSIPLHLLDGTFSFVQTRDFERLPPVAQALQNLVRTQLLPARNAFVWIKMFIAIGYFVAFLLVLRCRNIRALFSAGRDRGSGASSP
jgi:hypothetical protein